MRSMRTIAGTLAVAAAAVALVAPGAGARTALVEYAITGTASADATATGVSIQVSGATKNALRVLDVGDAFAATAGPKTKWVVISGLTPSHATPADIDAGDKVTIHVRAPRNASAATLASTVAWRIDDVSARSHPAGVLYWYTAKVTSVDTAATKLNVNVTDGNIWGLRSMLGAPIAESFSYNASTVFVRGGAHGPVLISAGSLHTGDTIAIRSWAVRWSSVSSISASPAAWVRLVKAAP